jgi:hypothetical protein
MESSKRNKSPVTVTAGRLLHQHKVAAILYKKRRSVRALDRRTNTKPAGPAMETARSGVRAVFQGHPPSPFLCMRLYILRTLRLPLIAGYRRLMPDKTRPAITGTGAVLSGGCRPLSTRSFPPSRHPRQKHPAVTIRTLYHLQKRVFTTSNGMYAPTSETNTKRLLLLKSA